MHVGVIPDSLCDLPNLRILSTVFNDFEGLCLFVIYVDDKYKVQFLPL